jgi:hypothetical protein
MKTHQILHFNNGEKRTLFNVTGVKDNEFTHLMLEDGRKVLINKENLLMIEIFPDDPELCQHTWGTMFNVYSANESNQWEYLGDGILGTTNEENAS